MSYAHQRRRKALRKAVERMHCRPTELPTLDQCRATIREARKSHNDSAEELEKGAQALFDFYQATKPNIVWYEI